LKRLAVDIEDDEHNHLKSIASSKGMTITKVISTMIKKWIKKNAESPRVPEPETRK
jgi:ParG